MVVWCGIVMEVCCYDSLVNYLVMWGYCSLIVLCCVVALCGVVCGVGWGGVGCDMFLCFYEPQVTFLLCLLLFIQ